MCVIAFDRLIGLDFVQCIQIDTSISSGLIIGGKVNSKSVQRALRTGPRFDEAFSEFGYVNRGYVCYVRI